MIVALLPINNLSSKELTSWINLQVEIFCKARLLQKISTCSLGRKHFMVITSLHDMSVAKDVNSSNI